MNLLPNANLSLLTFSSLIASLANTTRNKERKSDSRMFVSLQRAENAIAVVKAIIEATSAASALNNQESAVLSNFAIAIRLSIKPYEIHESTFGLSVYISLTDSVAALGGQHRPRRD